MKLKTLSISSLFLFALALLMLNSLAHASTASSTYGFEVSITPDAKIADAFQAKLTITDLASATIVAQPTVLFRAGESADTSIGENDNGVTFHFSVSVTESGSEANYKAEALQKGAILSRSQAKISLSK